MWLAFAFCFPKLNENATELICKGKILKEIAQQCQNKRKHGAFQLAQMVDYCASADESFDLTSYLSKKWFDFCKVYHNHKVQHRALFLHTLVSIPIEIS